MRVNLPNHGGSRQRLSFTAVAYDADALFPFTFPFFAMDSDRKSTVSSFYGGRRSSADALNRDYLAAAPSSDPRARRDSSSSFFNPAGPGALPRGAAVPSRTNGAGYNRMSYFDAGREEPVKGGLDEVEQPNEGGWDVYADFNNAGPRYSHAFGIGNNESKCVAFLLYRHASVLRLTRA